MQDRVSVLILEHVQDDDDLEEDKGKKVRMESKTSPTETGKEVKKRKHSISAHLQAEINKQKIIKAKQDRENRRADLDTHHLFLIEIISYHLDMKPKDIEEFVIDSADYMANLDSFFDKKGKKAVIFVYQDADPPGLGIIT